MILFQSSVTQPVIVKVYVVWKGLPEPVVKQRQSAFELTEADRGELKELRTKNSDLKMLVEKLLSEVTKLRQRWHETLCVVFLLFDVSSSIHYVWMVQWLRKFVVCLVIFLVKQEWL